MNHYYIELIWEVINENTLPSNDHPPYFSDNYQILVNIKEIKLRVQALQIKEGKTYLSK